MNPEINPNAYPFQDPTSLANKAIASYLIGTGASFFTGVGPIQPQASDLVRYWNLIFSSGASNEVAVSIIMTVVHKAIRLQVAFACSLKKGSDEILLDVTNWLAKNSAFIRPGIKDDKVFFVCHFLIDDHNITDGFLASAINEIVTPSFKFVKENEGYSAVNLTLGEG